MYQAETKCTKHLLLLNYTLLYTCPEKQSIQYTLCYNSLHCNFFHFRSLKAAYSFKLIKDYVYLFARDQQVCLMKEKVTNIIFCFLDCENFTLVHFAEKKPSVMYTLLIKNRVYCAFCFRFPLETLD